MVAGDASASAVWRAHSARTGCPVQCCPEKKCGEEEFLKGSLLGAGFGLIVACDTSSFHPWCGVGCCSWACPGPGQFAQLWERGKHAASRREALRVTYQEPFEGPVGLTGILRSGQFDFIHPSAWNGVTLAQKFYGELGSCVVDYSVHCSGKDAVLRLTDSCGERSDNRSLWFARSTELHMEKSWLHPWRKGNEMILKVFLASQHRSVRMTHDGSKVTFRLVSPPTLEEGSWGLET
eukprot:s144_g25.t1